MSEPSAAEPVLVLEDLHASYGDSHVLQGCSLKVGRECVTVLGRNGMGAHSTDAERPFHGIVSSHSTAS